MAHLAEGDEHSITILVRSPKDKKDITLKWNSTVKELKALCAREFVAAVSQICVIFSGKILDDANVLPDCGVRDGATVHLVIKSAHHSALAGLPVAADVSATPFGLGGLGGLAGLSGLGMGSANFMDLQQKMMQEMVTNPDMMRTLLDSPFVQQMMSSPETMRSLMLINPQLREVMERNPEIMQTMSEPELMKRMIDVVRSPAMLQELMRGQEHLIGGLRVPSASASTTAADESEKSDADSAAKATTKTGGDSNELFNEGGVRSMLQQISQNPQLMTNMLQAPYVQCMFQSMSQNPALVQQMLASSPIFADNPTLQAQLPAAVPYFAQQLQNPEIQCMMSNPRALQAMLLIQQGMQELNATMPSVINGDSAPTAEAAAASEGAKADDEYTQFMSRMLSMVASPVNSDSSNQMPEQSFAVQLHQLSLMGFCNRDANIEALSAVQGDVNSAVNRLLQQS